MAFYKTFLTKKQWDVHAKLMKAAMDEEARRLAEIETELRTKDGAITTNIAECYQISRKPWGKRSGSPNPTDVKPDPKKMKLDDSQTQDGTESGSFQGIPRQEISSIKVLTRVRVSKPLKQYNIEGVSDWEAEDSQSETDYTTDDDPESDFDTETDTDSSIDEGKNSTTDEYSESSVSSSDEYTESSASSTDEYSGSSASSTDEYTEFSVSSTDDDIESSGTEDFPEEDEETDSSFPESESEESVGYSSLDDEDF